MWLKKTTVLDAATLTKWQRRVNATTALQDLPNVSVSQSPSLPNGQLTVTAVTANSADITLTWASPQRATGEISRLSTRVTLPP